MRSLPATWMGFSVLDPVINPSWHKQYLPCCRVRFIRIQNTEKGLEECSKHLPARFFTFQFLLFSNTRVLPYDYHTYLTVLSYVFDLNIDRWEICYKYKYAIEPGPMSLIEVGLLRVGYLLSEGLLFSGGRYFRDLTEATIFWWYFRGGLFSPKFTLGPALPQRKIYKP